MNVTINYKPRNWALKLHNSTRRWHVIVAHRRAGKTTASLNHLIRECFRNPDPHKRYAYVAPTYKQAKNIAWDLLKSYSIDIPGVKFNEAELRCDFPNGARITLYGAENVDALRGMALWGVIYDEYSQQPSTIHSEVISKALADHKGFAIWIGTPKGRNAFFDLHKTASENPKRYTSVLLTIDDTIRDEEGTIVENLKEALHDDERQVEEGIITKDEFNQEWYCSFDAAIRGAYYADELDTLRTKGHITRVPYEPILPVTTAWDLGMKDYTSIGFFQHVGTERRMIDFIQDTGKGLDFYISEVLKRPYVYEQHIAPHDILVRELGSGRSRLEMAETLGITFDIADKISVQDGITAVRSILPSLWIDQQNCQEFIDALSQYQKEWDDRAGHFKDKPKHNWTSHAADMIRYYAVGFQKEEAEEEFIDITTHY